MVGISTKTVQRSLRINPEMMCMDGSKTRKSVRLLDPYRVKIQNLVTKGFKNTVIMGHLKAEFPYLNIKRTTLDDYCRQLWEEIFEHIPIKSEDNVA